MVKDREPNATRVGKIDSTLLKHSAMNEVESGSDFGLDDDFEIDDDGMSDTDSTDIPLDENEEVDLCGTLKNGNDTQIPSNSPVKSSHSVLEPEPGFNKNCFSNSKDWSVLQLSRPLLKGLVDLGFKRPTAIQRQAIPFALQGRDVLGTAQTGSGKTAAFLLPMLERLCQSNAVKQRKMTASGPIGGGAATKALVLLPTRELAVQCYEMLQALSKYTPITKILVTGGLSQKSQEMSFRQQPDIVIATPGRILDILLNSQSVHIELLEIVVLDEADRLLEMGFKDECLRVLSHCSKGKQTLLFSATLSEAIKDLALLSLKRPIRIDVSINHTLPDTLEQVLVPVPSEVNDAFPVFREGVLLHLCFESYKKHRTIIFFRTKRSAHRTALIFRLLGIPHSELHGNLTQAKRLEALENFHSRKDVRFLICSELAARGLDIPNVDLVILFMVPPDSARYIHQVGRTARIGKKGISVTLFSPEEKLQAKRVIRAATKGHDSSVLKRSVKLEACEKWQKKIQELEPKIHHILQAEHLERELRLAEMEAKKVTNMQLYQDEILTRPKKRWLNPQLQNVQSPVEGDTDNEEQLLNNIEMGPDPDDLTDENVLPSENEWDSETSSIASGVDSESDLEEPRIIQTTSNINEPKSFESSGVHSKPKQIDSKASNQVSKQVKKRLIKTQVKGQEMTNKQRRALQEQRVSRTAGSRVKKSMRPKRMRVNEDDTDMDHCHNSNKKKFKKVQKNKKKFKKM